jgi:putative spermidine/putrescine transport system substrate-binding protein
VGLGWGRASSPNPVGGVAQDGLAAVTSRFKLVLCAQVVAALALAVAAPAAAARDLTVALLDDFAPTALRTAYVEPFAAAAHLSVDVARWQGGAVPPGDPPWDVVAVNDTDLLAGCAAGRFAKLDWATLGGREKFLAQGVSDCGLGVALRATVLAWNRDKVQGSPGWADFWDVVKWPGKRGLRRSVRSTLPFALLADGVAPGDVFRELATPAGVDRAFRKLDQLRPYIVWWRNNEDAARLLAAGEVLMTSAPASVVADADAHGEHFGAQWAGAVQSVVSFAIVKDSPNAAAALRLLQFAATPAAETKLPALAHLGGLARGANDGLPPEVLATSPTAPAALGNAVAPDAAFWRDNLDKLTQRFDAWLGRGG